MSRYIQKRDSYTRNVGSISLQVDGIVNCTDDDEETKRDDHQTKRNDQCNDETQMVTVSTLYF